MLQNRNISIVLAGLLLAGCSAANDAAFPKTEISVERDGRNFSIIHSFDPAVPGHYQWVSLSGARLKGSDRAEVIDIVEKEVGPQFCNGKPMKFTEGAIWGGLGPDYATFDDARGRWIIVTTCT